MMFVLALVLALAALTAMSWALLGQLDTLPLPMACPKCRGGIGWGRSREDWFERGKDGVLRCRQCRARFAEQHDGSLHEEPTNDS